MDEDTLRKWPTQPYLETASGNFAFDNEKIIIFLEILNGECRGNAERLCTVGGKCCTLHYHIKNCHRHINLLPFFVIECTLNIHKGKNLKMPSS